jgi:hypothetical protein
VQLGTATVKACDEERHERAAHIENGIERHEDLDSLE